jgi:hypothetical protein
MAPLLRPPPQTGGSQLVLVPVPGAVVLCVCVLLIFACLVWLSLLWQKGIDHDKTE